MFSELKYVTQVIQLRVTACISGSYSSIHGTGSFLVWERSCQSSNQNFCKTDSTNNDTPLIYFHRNFKHCHSQIKLNNTTTYEISKINKSLKSKPHIGVVKYPIKSWRLALLLYYRINTYIYQGIIIRNISRPIKILWSIDTIKNVEETKISIYQPISPLASVSKIIEIIIYKSLKSYILENYILANEQFDFKENSITDMATHALLNNIQLSLDKNRLISEIFCNMQKEFDCVNRKQFLEKMK
jgi:hypothetical protein